MSVFSYLIKRGIEVSQDPKIIEEKSKDWSFVSPLLSKYTSLKADAVAFPKNEEEVISIVEFALQMHVPLIPRGAGYGTVGGLIPLKGGLIVDMSKMNHIKEHEDYVEAEAGAKFTFNARVYPTIYQKTTVGGYFCGGSWGIGSYEYGPNWDQVIEVTMVNPKGKLVTLKGGDIKIAAHAEGTTGIVTRLKILKREYTNDVSKLFLFDTYQDAIKFIQKIYEDEIPLYHITLRSPEIAKLTEKSTEFSTDKWQVLIAYPENREIKLEGGYDGTLLWGRRNLFFAAVYVTSNMLMKGIYYNQYHIPIEELSEWITKTREINPIIESEFANDWKGHTYFIVQGGERFNKLLELFSESSFNLHSIYINDRLPREHVSKIVNYKKAYDKEDLFNPGKVKFQ